jgi:hypothetical protein
VIRCGASVQVLSSLDMTGPKSVKSVEKKKLQSTDEQGRGDENRRLRARSKSRDLQICVVRAPAL